MTTVLTAPSAPRTRPGRGRRILAALVAVLLLVAGGAATVAGALQSSAGGYFMTGMQRFHTATAALKSDEILVGDTTATPGHPDPDIADLGRVRIKVTSNIPGARLFVGIGPKDKVEQFLRGTGYDEFAGATLNPLRVRFSRVAGAAAASRPDSQRFWEITRSGSTPLTLDWHKHDGPWSIVVMNSDGTPGVDVRAAVGFRFGFLLPVGIGGLVLAALLLAYAVLPRRRPDAA